MEKEIIETGKDVNWSKIQGEAEVLCSTWASIVLDLYDIGIASGKIVEFSTEIDNTIINIKAQDKAKSAESLAKMYSFLPEFMEKLEMEKMKKDIIGVKTNIINAYSNLESDNWDKINKEISDAENKMTTMVNEKSKEDDKKKYNINKTYILLEELKNSLSKKDKEIFYIKYKNLIQDMNTII